MMFGFNPSKKSQLLKMTKKVPFLFLRFAKSHERGRIAYILEKMNPMHQFNPGKKSQFPLSHFNDRNHEFIRQLSLVGYHINSNLY